ncbi:MAG: c-type cytochrome [Bacteroidota bacterium]
MLRRWMLSAGISACILGAIALLWASPPQVGEPSGVNSADLGKSVYEQRCAPCHGESGKGNGPNAFFLSPRPRDFTTGLYEFRSTEPGSIPTDEDLGRTISKGLPGTAMPGWEKFIHGDTLSAIILYIKAFSPRFAREQPKVVNIGEVRPSTPASIAAGKLVYDKLQCADCHGTDGAGSGAVAHDFQDDLGNPISAANLTEPWTFHGGSKAGDVYMRFRTGLDGTPMPSYVGSASDQEMWDLANYVSSIGRTPVWSMNEAELSSYYVKKSGIAKSDPIHWGKYLVDGLGCAHCHTPFDEKGEYYAQLKFAGGQEWSLGPYGKIVSYNLTSDSTTGLGGWSDDQIKLVLKKGTRRDGSRMLPFPMPWTAYSALEEKDLDAIIAYLRSIPPVSNPIPNPQPLSFFPYLAGKFQMLVLKKEFVVYVYPGNGGGASVEASPKDVSQNEVQP